MRICLTLMPDQDRELALPRHYNEYVQAFIYRHLDAFLARRLHDEGHLDEVGKRRLKFFTFSRLQGTWRAKQDRVVFSGSVRLVVASPMDDFLESLATHLLRSKVLRLGTQRVAIKAIEVEMPIRPDGPVLVNALSPITVYSTFRTAEGRSKTHYFSPF